MQPELNPDVEPYPENKIIGLMDDADDVRAAVDSLTRAGLEGDLNILCGPEGLAQLDVDGAGHGSFGRLVRSIQRFGVEREQLNHVGEELRNGRLAFSVRVSDEAKKGEIAQTLRDHGAHYLHYYGPWTIESLQ